MNVKAILITVVLFMSISSIEAKNSKTDDYKFEPKHIKPIAVFEKYDFNKGSYVLAGKRTEGGPGTLSIELGDWYTDDITLLNEIKKDWVFDTTAPAYMCGYDYEITLYEMGKPVEMLDVNTECGVMVTDQYMVKTRIGDKICVDNGHLLFKKSKLENYKSRLKKVTNPGPGTRVDGEEILKKYPEKKYEFDFNGDGKADVCTVICKKVKDYSTNKARKEKLTWYQFNIQIIDGKKNIMLDNWFSAEEADYKGMFERFGLSAEDPSKYVSNFFMTFSEYDPKRKVNEYELAGISKVDIDTDWIAEVIQRRKLTTSIDEVVNELLQGKHMVVQYRGNWVEDIRMFVYSEKLGESVRLRSSYETGR